MLRFPGVCRLQQPKMYKRPAELLDQEGLGNRLAFGMFLLDFFEGTVDVVAAPGRSRSTNSSDGVLAAAHDLNRVMMMRWRAMTFGRHDGMPLQRKAMRSNTHTFFLLLPALYWESKGGCLRCWHLEPFLSESGSGDGRYNDYMGPDRVQVQAKAGIMMILHASNAVVPTKAPTTAPVDKSNLMTLEVRTSQVVKQSTVGAKEE